MAVKINGTLQKKSVDSFQEIANELEKVGDEIQKESDSEKAKYRDEVGDILIPFDQKFFYINL